MGLFCLFLNNLLILKEEKGKILYVIRYMIYAAVKEK